MNLAGRDPAVNMKYNIEMASELLLSRVDPQVAINPDEAIPAWVVAKAKVLCNV